MISVKNFYFLFFISFSALSGQKDPVFDFIKDRYPYLKNIDFNMIKMEQLDDYFYFCGTANDSNGRPIQTDGLIEVYDIVMSTEKNGRLHEVANFNSFSRVGDVKCHLNKGLNEFILKNSTQKHCMALGKNDPNRKMILDVIRGAPTDRFIVKRICLSSNVAYFCGVVQDQEGIISKTGNAIDVYDVILKKEGQKWEQVKDLGKFSISLDNINCHFGDDDVILENDVLDKASHIFSENQ